MKLTRSVSYAVGILLQIHKDYSDSPLTAAHIARGGKYPPRFLYRVLRRLVDAGLLSGTSGPGGGYALARSPRSITLLDIVEAVETPPAASVLTAVRPKQRRAIDAINKLCRRAAKQFQADLKKMTLARLSLLASRK